MKIKALTSSVVGLSVLLLAGAAQATAFIETTYPLLSSADKELQTYFQAMEENSSKYMAAPKLVVTKEGYSHEVGSCFERFRVNTNIGLASITEQSAMDAEKDMVWATLRESDENALELNLKGSAPRIISMVYTSDQVNGDEFKSRVVLASPASSSVAEVYRLPPDAKQINITLYEGCMFDQ